MCDLSELEPTTKEIAVCIIIMLAVLVGVFGAGYMLGIRNAGAGVSDHRDAAQHVREEIESAGSDISAAKSRIDNAVAAAGRIEERISNAQERAGYLQGTVNEGRRLVAECESVLREVRAGGKTAKVKD